MKVFSPRSPPTKAKDRFGELPCGASRYLTSTSGKNWDLLVRTREINSFIAGRLDTEGVPALLIKFRRGVLLPVMYMVRMWKIAGPVVNISMLHDGLLPGQRRSSPKQQQNQGIFLQMVENRRRCIVVADARSRYWAFSPISLEKAQESWTRKKVIVTVGEAASPKRKGQDMMIRACPLIRGVRCKDAYYCIVVAGRQSSI